MNEQLTPLQRDLNALGLHVSFDMPLPGDTALDVTISFWDTPEVRGRWTGARMEVTTSAAKPTIWAQLTTRFSQRSQMVGKAVVIVTITCPNGVILARSYPIKFEVAARRLAAHLAAARS